MAQLTLLSALAEHFRRTDNRWQTAYQIGWGIGKDLALVRMSLQNQYNKGHLERDTGSPRRYRFKHDALALGGRSTSPPYSPARVAAEFCAKWGVSVPYEATRDNPEALTEWTEMLRR